MFIIITDLLSSPREVWSIIAAGEEDGDLHKGVTITLVGGDLKKKSEVFDLVRVHGRWKVESLIRQRGGYFLS